MRNTYIPDEEIYTANVHETFVVFGSIDGCYISLDYKTVERGLVAMKISKAIQNTLKEIEKEWNEE